MNPKQQIIKGLVRDLCLVGMRTKSQTREIITEATDKLEAETIKKMKENFPKPEGALTNYNWEKYVQRIDEWKNKWLNQK